MLISFLSSGLRCAETAGDLCKSASSQSPVKSWGQRIVKKGMIESAISETLAEIRPSKENGRLRFTEDCKKVLAEGVEVFLQHHYHTVALLTSHRGACAPASKDFQLASKLQDPAEMQRSVLEAELESEIPRKRLRRMADVSFQVPEVAHVEVAHVD